MKKSEKKTNKKLHRKNKLSKKKKKKLFDQLIFLESQKIEWIEMVASADIQTTISEIKDYAIEKNLPSLIKKIVNLSSRWNRINQSDNHGTINIDEKNKEINKINDSLLDLIMAMK